MSRLSLLEQPRIKNLLLLSALCFVLFFWRLGELPFYNRGEPREGLVVQEMYASGDWVLPRVNGDYIPFKPPLYHWVATITSKFLGGVDEFTVRFPSALFGTLAVLLTYLMGTRLWGETAGAFSAVLLATCPDWWQAATIAQVDMTLAFFTMAAILLFYASYIEGEVTWLSALGLPLLMALATLAKGPVGLLLPGLTIFIFLALRRDLVFLKKFHFWTGLALFLVVAGSWYALAAWEEGWEFVSRQIIDENLGTAAGTWGHFQPYYYYIPVFLGNTAPWNLFFPALIFFLWTQRRRLVQEHYLYCLVWWGTVFAFFSLSLGKRGIYILPLYPAISLLVGAWWNKLESEKLSSLWLTRIAAYLIGASYLLVSAALLAGFFRHDIVNHVRFLSPFRTGGNSFPILDVIVFQPLWVALAIGIIGLAAVFLVCFAFMSRWNYAKISFALVLVISVLLVKHIYFPLIAKERTLKPFMARVEREVDPSRGDLFAYQPYYYDYGAVFYLGRHIPPYRIQTSAKPPFFLLIWEDEWARLPDHEGLRVLDVSEGKGPADRHRMFLIEAQKAPPYQEELPATQPSIPVED